STRPDREAYCGRPTPGRRQGPVPQVRVLGDQRYLRWSKFGGMSVSDAKRLNDSRAREHDAQGLLAASPLESKFHPRGLPAGSDDRTGAVLLGAERNTTQSSSLNVALAVVVMSPSTKLAIPHPLLPVVKDSSAACVFMIGCGGACWSMTW